LSLLSLHDALPISASEALGTGTSKFDLTLFLSETEHGLEGVVEYSTDLFEAATMRRLCGHYRTLLEGIVRQPDQSLATLPLLTGAERQQQVDWNHTAVAWPGQDRRSEEHTSELQSRGHLVCRLLL